MRRDHNIQANRFEIRCEGVARAIKMMYEEAAKEQKEFDFEIKELSNMNYKLHQKVFMLQRLCLQLRKTKRNVCAPNEIDEYTERLARVQLATHLADEELKRFQSERQDLEKQNLRDEINARRRASQQAVMMAEAERTRRLNLMKMAGQTEGMRSPSPQFTPRSRKAAEGKRSRHRKSSGNVSISSAGINFDPVAWPRNSLTGMEALMVGTDNQNIQTVGDFDYELYRPPDNTVDYKMRRESQRLSIVMSENERQRRMDNFASGADEMARQQHRTSLFKMSLEDLFDDGDI